MKLCTKCGLEKPLDQFFANKKNRGHRSYCKKCYMHAYYSGRKKEAANVRRRARGEPVLTETEIQTIYDRQNGKCAVCSKALYLHFTDAPKRDKIHLDHDHVTGQPRGILCSRCNIGIGLLGDSYESLQRAVDYLVPEYGGITSGCM